MRVLIVSPHTPPSNAADMQRVRMLLPYLYAVGIEAEVLADRAEDVACPLDPWLAEGLPEEVPIHRVQALSLKWARIPGLGTLGFRAIRALRRAGDTLLAEGAFDLVYFSTTVFPVHTLGPRWKKKFGVPFVMDYQDPWVSDYYQEHPDVVPPGGRLKYAVASWLNRRQEPRVLRHCSGITSVSPAYPEQLAKRYSWLKVGRDLRARTLSAIGVGREGLDDSNAYRADGDKSADRAGSALPAMVLPFPGDARDFERVKSEGIRQSVFDPNDGFKHWVYVGRGGGDMIPALRAIFAALATGIRMNPVGRDGPARPLVAEGVGGECMDDSFASHADGDKSADRAGSALPLVADSRPASALPIKNQQSTIINRQSLPHADGDKSADRAGSALPMLHFIGTSYAAAGQGVKIVEPLAEEYGLEGLVHESTDRIPYSETLRCLLDADALIIPGSDDPGYTASKIYPYLLAGKPLLAVFHEQSSVVELIRKVGGGTVIPFATGEQPEVIAERIASEWLSTGGPDQAVPLDEDAFAPYTAKAQAEMLVGFWKECVER